jgi:hypothetical protein
MVLQEEFTLCQRLTAEQERHDVAKTMMSLASSRKAFPQNIRSHSRYYSTDDMASPISRLASRVRLVEVVNIGAPQAVTCLNMSPSHVGFDDSNNGLICMGYYVQQLSSLLHQGNVCWKAYTDCHKVRLN